MRFLRRFGVASITKSASADTACGRTFSLRDISRTVGRCAATERFGRVSGVSEADWGIVALSCKPACPTKGSRSAKPPLCKGRCPEGAEGLFSVGKAGKPVIK